MNITNFIVTMSQNTQVQSTSLFPFPFHIHIIFTCLALVFFIIQYSKEKKPYQLLMAIAIPVSLAIWLSDSKILFYIVGIAELILLSAALVTSIVGYIKNKGNDTESASAEEKKSDDEENETAETSEEKFENAAEEKTSEDDGENK